MTNVPDFQDINDGQYHDDETGMPRFAKRLTGLVILLISAAACLAFASWNIEDPSFTHATDSAVTNFLGFPGAALSDFLLQFFGLGALALISLPAIWGWKFFRLKMDTITGRQGFFYLLAVLLIAIVASSLPTPETWPLPTGLGGIIGTALFYPVTSLSSSGLGSWVTWLAAFILLIPIPYLVLHAFFHDRQAAKTTKTDKREKKRAPKISHGEEFEDEEQDSLSTLIFGALTHWFYLGKTNLSRRLIAKKQQIKSQHVPQHDLTLDDESEASGFASTFAAIGQLKRRLIDEPIADDGLGDYLHRMEGQQNSPAHEPQADLRSEPPFQEPASHLEASSFNEHTPEPQMETIRVSTMAPPEKPGKRVIAEAQPTLPLMKTASEYELPPLNFLKEAPFVGEDQRLSNDVLTQNAELLEGVLEDFGVKGEIVHVRPGPVVTLYELEPAPGIKSSRVIGLADDIARSMSAIAARVAVIPGKNAIGIELPNQKRETVYLHEALSSKNFESNKGKLPLCLGKTIGGESVIADLARMPHLLVAGTTGSGKSVAINTMILSLLYRFKPDQCKLIMIDPKMLELSVYDGIPHLLTPVVTDPKKAVVALKWTVREMEDRYKKMSKVGVRNIDGFNQRVRQAEEKNEPIVRTIQTGYDQETGEAIYEREELGLDPMPYIVVIIDEMADLMMVAGKDIEGAIQRLAQMARAAGIHVIMATQRPSVDVITGTIKANFPTRISFQVTSKIDSRTILGEQGAEQLLGMGDMLYMAGGGRIQRVHGPFVSDEEVENVVMHLKDQGIPQYLEAITEEVEEADEPASGGGNVSDTADPYDQAVAVVLRDKKASTSYIQRRLGIGYNRAATIIERMEDEGIVGPANHAGKREILVGSDPEEDFAH